MKDDPAARAVKEWKEPISDLPFLRSSKGFASSKADTSSSRSWKGSAGNALPPALNKIKSQGYSCYLQDGFGLDRRGGRHRYPPLGATDPVAPLPKLAGKKPNFMPLEPLDSYRLQDVENEHIRALMRDMGLAIDVDLAQSQEAASDLDGGGGGLDCAGSDVVGSSRMGSATSRSKGAYLEYAGSDVVGSSRMGSATSRSKGAFSRSRPVSGRWHDTPGSPEEERRLVLARKQSARRVAERKKPLETTSLLHLPKHLHLQPIDKANEWESGGEGSPVSREASGPAEFERSRAQFSKPPVIDPLQMLKHMRGSTKFSNHDSDSDDSINGGLGDDTDGRPVQSKLLNAFREEHGLQRASQERAVERALARIENLQGAGTVVQVQPRNQRDNRGTERVQRRAKGSIHDLSRMLGIDDKTQAKLTFARRVSAIMSPSENEQPTPTTQRRQSDVSASSGLSGRSTPSETADQDDYSEPNIVVQACDFDTPKAAPKSRPYRSGSISVRAARQLNTATMAGGKRGQREATGFESVTEQDGGNPLGQQRRRVIPAMREYGKMAKTLSGASTTPTVQEETSGLQKIRLTSSRMSRLKRIEKLTKLFRYDAKQRRMLGLSDADMSKIREVFQRYDYNKSGGLDVLEVSDALADLGLKPTSKRDKAHLTLIIQGFGSDLDFMQFCKVVQERRVYIREAQHENLWRTFQRYDSDGSGALSADELVKVFKDLSLSADRDDERIAFFDAVMESDIDGSGEIEWQEFEPLVQLVREKLYICRREREVRIAQQVKLCPDVFLAFRPQLIAIHDAFTRYDTRMVGAIGHDDIINLMYEMGFEKDLTVIKAKCAKDPILEEIFEHHESIDFAVALQVGQRLRDLRFDNKTNIQTIFEMYDSDHSGDLSLDEILKILRDLGCGVARGAVLENIKKIIDDCDANGNGQIDVEEFHQVFAEVTEMLLKKQRQEESEASAQLGFAESELRDLREVFSLLDTRNTGSLPVREMMKALELVNEFLHTSPTVEDVRRHDTENLGRISFVGFLRILKEGGMKTRNGGKLSKRMSDLLSPVFGTKGLVSNEPSDRGTSEPNIGTIENLDDRSHN